MNRVESPRVRAHGLLERELAFEVLRDALGLARDDHETALATGRFRERGCEYL